MIKFLLFSLHISFRSLYKSSHHSGSRHSLSNRITPRNTQTINTQSAKSEQMPVNQKQKPEVQERMYKTKVIQFLRRNTPIILQNDNGACALIAICNALLLENCMDLKPDGKDVSEKRLLELVGDHLLASRINNKDTLPEENPLTIILKEVDLLPGFARGINVDIKFNRINDFEATKDRAIFDKLQIPLYHGWIIDPKDIDTANAIGNKSHDKLVEEFVVPHMDALKLTETVDGKLKDVGSSSHVVDEGELVRNFLENNATQLTPYGLSRLNSDIKEGEVSVFFRNNHFNTMFKYEGALFILLTDEGYKSTPDVIWEKLHEVKHTLLANSDFKVLNPSSSEIEEVSDDMQNLEELPKCEPPPNSPSRLITGPEENSPQSSSSKKVSKRKSVEKKCNLM